MTVPTSHASPAASSSGDSSPPSPTAPSSVPGTAVADANSPALAKRKTSRRANTAERRATHNAVERARRETLNARFLLLASLLPNLSQIRRPSKSSIVNSSIAHVHASRRHRQLAARELRALKNECDAQRRELNEWRDRANMPRLEETMRSEGFLSVLSGEMETLVVQVGEDEDDEVMMAEYGYEDINDYPQHSDVVEDPRMAMGAAPAPMPPMAALPRRPSISLSHIAPHVSSPMVASPTTMSFENPVMGVYESQHIPYGYSHNPHAAIGPKDVAAWNLGMYQQQQQQIILQQQRQQHPQPHPADPAYLATLHRQRERSSSIASYHSATSGGGGTPPLSSGGSSPTMGFDTFPADGWMMGAPQPQPVAAGGGGNPVYAAMM